MFLAHHALASSAHLEVQKAPNFQHIEAWLGVPVNHTRCLPDDAWLVHERVMRPRGKWVPLPTNTSAPYARTNATMGYNTVARCGPLADTRAWKYGFQRQDVAAPLRYRDGAELHSMIPNGLTLSILGDSLSQQLYHSLSRRLCHAIPRACGPFSFINPSNICRRAQYGWGVYFLCRPDVPRELEQCPAFAELVNSTLVEREDLLSAVRTGAAGGGSPTVLIFNFYAHLYLSLISPIAECLSVPVDGKDKMSDRGARAAMGIALRIWKQAISDIADALAVLAPHTRVFYLVSPVPGYLSCKTLPVLGPPLQPRPLTEAELAQRTSAWFDLHPGVRLNDGACAPLRARSGTSITSVISNYVVVSRSLVPASGSDASITCNCNL